jgi:hypothetical protein
MTFCAEASSVECMEGAYTCNQGKSKARDETRRRATEAIHWRAFPDPTLAVQRQDNPKPPTIRDHARVPRSNIWIVPMLLAS